MFFNLISVVGSSAFYNNMYALYHQLKLHSILVILTFCKCCQVNSCRNFEDLTNIVRHEDIKWHAQNTLGSHIKNKQEISDFEHGEYLKNPYDKPDDVRHHHTRWL